jgi:hypothetical protein
LDRQTTSGRNVEQMKSFRGLGQLAAGLVLFVFASLCLGRFVGAIACGLPASQRPDGQQDVSDREEPNAKIATGRDAVVIPLAPPAAQKLASGAKGLQITVRALKVDPEEQLVIQAEITSRKLPRHGNTVDVVDQAAPGSAFFRPLQAGETRDVYLSMSGLGRSAEPPYAVVVAVTQFEQRQRSIKSVIEILRVDVP